jgi:hypothetical protein
MHNSKKNENAPMSETAFTIAANETLTRWGKHGQPIVYSNNQQPDQLIQFGLAERSKQEELAHTHARTHARTHTQWSDWRLQPLQLIIVMHDCDMCLTARVRGCICGFNWDCVEMADGSWRSGIMTWKLVPAEWSQQVCRQHRLDWWPLLALATQREP